MSSLLTNYTIYLLSFMNVTTRHMYDMICLCVTYTDSVLSRSKDMYTPAEQIRSSEMCVVMQEHLCTVL